MHGSGPSRAWRLVAATAALLASVTALGAVSLASAPEAGASVACVANAPAGSERTCGLTAWVGSTYDGGAHPNGSTPTLTTAGVFSALTAKAGSDATISLDWSSSATDYGEPPACSSSLSVPATTVRGETTVLHCGYWSVRAERGHDQLGDALHGDRERDRSGRLVGGHADRALRLAHAVRHDKCGLRLYHRVDDVQRRLVAHAVPVAHRRGPLRERLPRGLEHGNDGVVLGLGSAEADRDLARQHKLH